MIHDISKQVCGLVRIGKTGPDNPQTLCELIDEIARRHPPAKPPILV